jgi:hypothetical protein
MDPDFRRELLRSRHKSAKLTAAKEHKAMAESAYSYATHLDIKFDPLKLIDVSSLAKAVTDQWYNQTLCKVYPEKSLPDSRS